MVESTAAAGVAVEKKRLNFNLLTLGEHGVGKNSIFKRYVYKNFDPSKMATSGVDF